MKAGGISIKQIIRLYKMAQPWLGLLIAATAALLVITGVNLATPYITKMVLALLENNFSRASLPRVYLLGGLLLALLVLRGVCQHYHSYLGHKASWNLVARARTHIYEHFQLLSLGYYNDKQTGQLMSRVINDTATFENLIAHAIPDLTTNILTVIGVVAILFATNRQLAWIICIPLPFIFCISYFMRKLRQTFRLGQQEVAILSAMLQDNFSGMREIQAFNKQEYELDRIAQQAQKHANVLIKSLWYSSLMTPIVNFLSSIGMVIVLIFGPLIALGGGLAVSDVVAFLLYLGLLYAPVATLTRVFEDLQQSVAGAERVFEVLDTPSQISDAPGAWEAPRLTGLLEFNHVSFSYNDDTKVLDDLCFCVKPGEMVALVGPTGVGKTTIASLITRFYEPLKGCITIDGRDISGLTLRSLRNQLSLVLQDVFLFTGTISENISYGRAEASPAEIEEAAKTACIHQFILSLPEGYDTLVGERGVRLSGGQKQRISIARAVLRNSPILLLDEATSAVDTETENEIQEAIAKIAGTRTLLVIAHRLSTIQRADQILVLENGRIVERGRHEELLAQNGLYYTLCSRQNVY